MEAGLIYNRLIEKTGFTIKALEQKFQLSNGSIGKAIKRKSEMKPGMIELILKEFPDLNRQWLLTGEDPPPPSQPANRQKYEGAKTVVAARDSWAGGGGQAKENPRPQGQGLDKDVLLLQMIDKVNQSHEAIMSMHTEVFRSLDETRVLLNSEIVARDAVQKVTFARLAELSKGKYSADDLLEQALEVAGVRDLGSPVSKETAGTAG